jgi:LAS superfamily LD-carboxypeptidase LdcB
MLPALLTGQVETHLLLPENTGLDVPVHRDILEPFQQLRAAAADAGFDLAILSGFRSFDRQLSIWNRKATGQLPVLDSDARPLDISVLGEADLAFAILRWSALPGASRHHWGTDLDVYDAAALPPGYVVDLVPAEVNPGGMFAALHGWLDERITSGAAFGFHRPYDRDRGGVAPERWHLSHGPVAAGFESALSIDALRQAIEPADMMLKEAVLTNLAEIFERFVANVAVPDRKVERTT